MGAVVGAASAADAGAGAVGEEKNFFRAGRLPGQLSCRVQDDG